MKSNIFKRVVAVFLCLMIGLSLMSVGFTASAYHYDDDTIHSYEDLNCAEDDCDCLEPDENVFKVVSPVSGTSVNENCADVVFTGAYHEVQDYYRNLGQTDGMTVIPPTTLKVEKFMRYIPQNDTDVVATVASTGRVITAYQVAVNAVMSGCSAEYLPLCIAFTKAFNDAEYVSSLKDGKLTPMAFVNGPLARQLGIDNTQGMTTEEANIALGRFIELALINLAGIASERSTSFGYMQPLVFSENDAACLDIGWEPYNVQQGFGLNESTVTATSFSMWGNNVTPATDLPEQIMKVIAWDITEKNLGGLGAASSEEYANTKRVIFITPQVANALATLYKDKENLEDALIETALRPMWMRTYAYFYAGIGANLTGKSISDVYTELVGTEAEKAKLTASPDWLIGITNPNIETGKVMAKGNTIFLVTGDDSRNKTQVMPGGVSITYKAECSDMYENLVTSMNYQPIENYYLSGNDFTVTPPDSVTSVLTNGTYRILDSSTGSTYLTREGRVYFDSSTNTLYYYAVGASAKASVVLDATEDADFIAYLENLGPNSSFRVYNGKLKDATIRFSSNANKPDTNTVVLTAESFEGLTLTLHANNTDNSLAAGGVAGDGSTVTMSDTVTSFTVNMDGDVVMGHTNHTGFVTLDGTTVTLNPNAPVGSKAIIGTANSDGTYRTMTFENRADGTYKITYNTANTLSLENSAIYLKGTFNDWKSTDALKRTDTEGVYTLTKAFEAGTYTFKIDANGSWYGNKGSFTDSAMRWGMSTSVSDNCTFKATGGTYTFAWDDSAKRLTVSKDSEELPEIPEVTVKTVYVGVVEHIKDFVPTLHYWNNSTGLAGDATLTATGETVQYAVGSAYWSNQKQNFKVYKTTVPAETVAMKTWDKGSNGKWAAEEVKYAEDQIILLFEYSGIYHNFTNTYIPVVPCEHTDVETLNAVAATCTNTGLSEGKKCNDCGEVITAQTVIPAKGHSEETLPGKDATCTENGLTEGKKCSVCGTIIKAQTEIPAGHKEETVKGYDATCTEKGLTDGTKCLVCEETLKTQEEIPAKGHTEITLEAKAATCTETGLTEGKKCSVCGVVTAEQTEIPVKDHTEVIDEAVAATCTKTGLTQGKHCSACGEILVKQETVDKLDHTEVTVEGKDATCTEDGFTSGVVCDVCGEIISAKETIPATGHTEDTIEGKDATCTETGLTDGTQCSICGEVIIAQTEIPALGHSESIVKGYAATCDKDGLTDGIECSVCGEVIAKQNVILATGHYWNDGTCASCGMVCQHTYTDGKCTNCGKLEYISELEGYSISLGGNIAVNFYMTFNKDVLEDEGAKLVFTLPDNTKKSAYVKNAAITDDGYYMFSCEVAAKEMSKTVKAQVVTSVGEGETYEYSVQKYAEYIIGSEDAKYEAAKPLAKAMLNYGAAAQEHFKYNTSNPANESLSYEEKELVNVDLSKFGYKLTGSESGVSYYGSRLTLESETAIKHYFYIADEDNIPTITVNGEEVKAHKSGSYYEVKILDILAQNLDAPIVVKVGNLTLDYNAFSYGYLAMHSDDTGLQNVIKALYAYNQAADAYLGSTN